MKAQTDTIPQLITNAVRWPRLITLCICTCATVADAGLLLTCDLGSSQTLRGSFRAIEPDYLILDAPGTGSTQQHILPISQIQQLQWTTDESDARRTMSELSQLRPLWGQFADGAQQELLHQLERMAASDQWQDCYRHSDYLLSLPQPDERRGRIAVLRLWSMMELGLTAAANDEVQRLREQITPLEAPLRFFWLAARLAQQQGNTDEATRWAALPFLRIPSASGPLADDLMRIHQQLLASQP